MSLIVQKFGGTSVADLDHIRGVAERVAASREKWEGVLVVVSAMAG
ncbi:MAG: aspartate kinase, partial [bacterium]